MEVTLSLLSLNIQCEQTHKPPIRPQVVENCFFLAL